MAQKLTKKDVLKLASLAKLRLENNEIDTYIDELNAILAYVEQLSDVDTEGLEPTSQVTGLENVTREDTVREYEASSSELLSLAPDSQGSYVKVRRMI